MTLRNVSVGLVCSAILTVCTNAMPVLTLTGNPPDTGGPVAMGMPGQVVGWDYMINNDTTDVLVITNSFFCQPLEDPQFTTCTQLDGVYNDYIAANGTQIPPTSSPSQMFTPGDPSGTPPGTGVGGYTISSTPLVPEDMGFVWVVFNECTPDFMTCSGDMFINAEADVQVIPEPSTFTLAAFAFALLLGIWRFRKLRA